MFQIDIYFGYNNIFLLLLLWESAFPEITSERCSRVLGIGVVRYSEEVFYNAQCILTCILKSKEYIWETEIVFSRNFLWAIMKQYPFPHPTDLLLCKFTTLEFIGASDDRWLMLRVLSFFWIRLVAYTRWLGCHLWSFPLGLELRYCVVFNWLAI